MCEFKANRQKIILPQIQGVAPKIQRQEPAEFGGPTSARSTSATNLSPSAPINCPPGTAQ
jgi:hypothetical protein